MFLVNINLNTNASNFVSDYQRSDWLVTVVLLSFRRGIRQGIIRHRVYPVDAST